MLPKLSFFCTILKQEKWKAEYKETGTTKTEPAFPHSQNIFQKINA
jgi:hypothetical protein